MDSKELRLFREAYSSIYEGYKEKEERGEKEEKECVDKEDKGKHNCAKKVCHESFGEGTCIFGEHAVPDENGFVSHYDVMFEHGVEQNVPVSEMEVLTLVEHPMEGHRYEGEQISEGPEEYSGGQHPSQSPNKAARDKYETQRRRAEAPKGVGVPDKSDGYGQLQQSVDLFDIVKGHLMSEGYADTEEAALAIMANMSEEWRQSIVEQMTVTDLDRKLNTPAYQRLMKGNPAYKGGGSGANQLQQGPLNRPGSMVKGV